MEKIIKSLGLKEDATEEEVVAELEKRQKESDTLKAEKSKLEADKQELTATVEGEKARSATLETNYKQLLDSGLTQKSEDKETNIYDELSEIKY